ncbi:NUDIX hydrolase [Raphidocelis subcapitata]|uniref:NUDIX hydrolase n=1 Tax=Raphidocelis subcapitata TaxID=307507 RepID=A0A2V0NZ96_9CHLO|nr:NUDIX hydrolase [Raphidocelis subcapitata]|eukprot:GBF92961.1 NUDIX hydrolase [Raphidocelis subcapitata]
MPAAAVLDAPPAPAAPRPRPADADAGAPEAEPEGEVLEIVDDACTVIGRELRGEVHRLGLLHRAVYVWVFDPSGRLLLQRRSWDKKIGPGQWDLSAAEHLSVGETFHQAAERGLREELGISASLPPAPAIPRHLRKVTQQLPDGSCLADCEFVESYRLDGFRGEVKVNEQEVIATRWATLEEVEAEMRAAPDSFTQWAREELPLLPR